MYLVFDIETTGLPDDINANVLDFDKFPRVVQLAWSLINNSDNIISTFNFIIKPDDFEIPDYVSEIHGITQERALNEGCDSDFVLNLFRNHVYESSFLVGHNIEFDSKILRVELMRFGMQNGLRNILRVKDKICTMKSTVDLCKIEGPYGYKWPTLSELYFFLFSEELMDAHDAAIDTEATVKCFFELKRMGLYNSIINYSRPGIPWGSDYIDLNEIFNTEYYTNDWKRWEGDDLLGVRTISKNHQLVYFDNGLVSENNDLFNEEVFIHGGITEDIVIGVFDEMGIGVTLRNPSKTEYKVDSHGITRWRVVK